MTAAFGVETIMNPSVRTTELPGSQVDERIEVDVLDDISPMLQPVVWTNLDVSIQNTSCNAHPIELILNKPGSLVTLSRERLDLILGHPFLDPLPCSENRVPDFATPPFM